MRRIIVPLLLSLLAAGCVSAAVTEGERDTTPEPTAVEDASAPLPVDAAPIHGSTVWGVYLAVALEYGDPALADAIDQAEAYGYTWTEGDISCDHGAAEALGVVGDAVRVAIYFETEANAQTVAEVLDPPPVGIAEVETFCLD